MHIKSLAVALLPTVLAASLAWGDIAPGPRPRPRPEQKSLTAAPINTLEHTVYSAPYFVKNTYEPKAKQSFTTLKTLDEFNGVFGVGMVMRGPKPTVGKKTFDSHVIVAVVTRGPMSHYTLQSVTAKGNVLEVRYQLKRDAPGAAEFSVPLIVAVPKADYAAVRFIENGKQVKELK